MTPDTAEMICRARLGTLDWATLQEAVSLAQMSLSLDLRHPNTLAVLGRVHFSPHTEEPVATIPGDPELLQVFEAVLYHAKENDLAILVDLPITKIIVYPNCLSAAHAATMYKMGRRSGHDVRCVGTMPRISAGTPKAKQVEMDGRTRVVDLT